MMQYFLNDGQVVFINFVYVCDFPLFFMCVIAACVLSYLKTTRFAVPFILGCPFYNGDSMS